MDKRLILSVFFCLSFLLAGPQLRLGIGQADYPAHEDLRFKGNNSFIEYTFNGESRLQFGLKYENTETIIDQDRRLGMSGILGTLKFYFNTMTGKTPYLGANIGWLNSNLTQEKDYSTRGVFGAEYFAGYSFRLNRWQRLNLEYLHLSLNDALGDGENLESDMLTISWGIVLDLDNRPVRHQTPEDGITTRKEYLRRRINHNLDQIERYDTLIGKYDQKLAEEFQNNDLLKERDYLLEQKRNLESDNQQMLELLER